MSEQELTPEVLEELEELYHRVFVGDEEDGEKDNIAYHDLKKQLIVHAHAVITAARDGFMLRKIVAQINELNGDPVSLTNKLMFLQNDNYVLEFEIEHLKARVAELEGQHE